mmetsp:Transcript_9840/g.23172  ORF Transcript_9840/g.23172 Transcript_9840/m.23172 type:complete len:128 (-) Transcript_9840:436-819(-)
MKRRHMASVNNQSQDTKLMSDNSWDNMSLGSGMSMEEVNTESNHTKRLIDWNVEVLQSQLKKIVAMRDSSTAEAGASALRIQREVGQTVLDEVKEVIPLSTKENSFKRNPQTILLEKDVVSQASKPK